MKSFSRRRAMAGMGGCLLTAACGNGMGSQGSAVIDARVTATLAHMYDRYPGAGDLRDKSAGILIMPLITEAGFGLGGSYGRGALQINGVTVDYYSATSASFGLQIGAQQFVHVLFFMTEKALSDFRRGSGWAAGGDIEYVISDRGGNLGLDTTNAMAPVIAVIFAQAGLHAGATLEGTKYTRIIP